jgi:hypothetical protein
MTKRLSVPQVAKILQHYEIGVTRQAKLDGNISLYGFDDPGQGRTIVLRAGTRESRRMSPLSEDQAEAMLAEIGHDAAHGEKERRTIAHLLVKTSQLYEETGIDRFELGLVLVHQDTFLVGNARMWSTRKPIVPNRLAAHAHDNRGRGPGPSENSKQTGRRKEGARV